MLIAPSFELFNRIYNELNNFFVVGSRKALPQPNTKIRKKCSILVMKSLLIFHFYEDQ